MSVNKIQEYLLKIKDNIAMKQLFVGLDKYISENYTGERQEEQELHKNVSFDEKLFKEKTFKEKTFKEKTCESVCSKPQQRPRKTTDDDCVSFAEAECADVYMAAPMQTLEDAVKNLGETFSQRLLRFIDESGKTSSDIYKKANIDRKLFSKIQCDVNYQPKKKTVLAFILALELGQDDARDLLASAGYALSPASVSDLIIEYFIKNGVYDIYTINAALYEHDQPVIN